MSLRTSDRCRAAVGFTLVELLVVIGIIALLISMLLPALNKARLAANRVTCMARMQQVGMALQSYRTDNRQHQPYFTVRLVDQIGKDYLWPFAIAKYAGMT